MNTLCIILGAFLIALGYLGMFLDLKGGDRVAYFNGVDIAQLARLLQQQSNERGVVNSAQSIRK